MVDSWGIAEMVRNSQKWLKWAELVRNGLKRSTRIACEGLGRVGTMVTTREYAGHAGDRVRSATSDCQVVGSAPRMLAALEQPIEPHARPRSDQPLHAASPDHYYS